MLLSAVRVWVPTLTFGTDVGTLAWLKIASISSAIVVLSQILPQLIAGWPCHGLG